MQVNEQVKHIISKIEKELPALLISGKESRIIIMCKQSKGTVYLIQEAKQIWTTKNGKEL